MGAAIKTKVGDKYNAWEVIEANVINPETTSKAYIGKAVFSKCICTKCNKTIRYFRNNELKKASLQCNSCSLIERNTKNKEVQIGKQFGYLKITGDGGYQQRNDGSRRHFSLCKCLLCGKENVLKMDNALQSGATTSCGCIASKGELKIQELLTKANISFARDVPFDELTKKTGHRLRFDFIIYNKDGSINRFIEFDGKQHEEGWDGGIWSNVEDFSIIKKRDSIKDNFCKENGYILIRIPYSKLKSLTLEDIMKEGDALC